MKINLTAAQQVIKDSACAFGLREIAQSAGRRDRDCSWDPVLFLRLGTSGFLGAPFPLAYGGQGHSALELMLLQEGLGEGAGDAGLCLSWCAHTILCGVPLWKMGTETQRQRYLVPMCRGKSVGGLAVSEAVAGSDSSAIQTRAIRRGDHWVLHGEKSWVTNAPVGDHFLVTARTGPGTGVDGISIFIVEKGFFGVRVGSTPSRLSLRTAPIGRLIFEGCEVPAENLLGRAGAWREVGALLSRWERTFLLAPWLGLMKTAVDACMGRVKERIQFGRPIGHFQAARAILADMKIRHAIARNFCYRAASGLDSGTGQVDRDAAVAKLTLAETAQALLRDAIQLHGAHGLVTENPLERAFRDATALTVILGNTDLLRSVIAGSFLDLG